MATDHVPYVPASRILPEITPKGVALAVILAMVLTAANVYLGLYVGMTVSASIPAAVLSMGMLRAIAAALPRQETNILENNWVQTAVSAGESLAAGVIFTLPALIVLGTWEDFAFFPVFITAAVGGTIGVLFSISLRRIFIIQERLPYPEGVACAEVLVAGEKGGTQVLPIIAGMGFGAIYKLGAAL
ncbi:MAG: oligopeptide transporter, OPT family, partial [Candidatus Thermoplasmatota archaeon]|nr:oligopeptide transporter, OPT family [Candidatus Thermoplasmatota archaeon]